MISKSHSTKSREHLKDIWIPLFLIAIVSTLSLSIFGQGTPTAFENLTEVEYDDCTGIATVTFPVRENYSICNQADQLRWLDVKAVPPTGSPFFVARVWKSSLIANPCLGGPSFTVLGCRTYNYCELSAGNELNITNGIGDQRFVELKIKDLPYEFFGAAIKFSFTGHYDYECCENTNATHSTQGYAIPLFEKSWNGGAISSTVPQASISMVSPRDCQLARIEWGTISPPGGCGTVSYDLWRVGYGFIATSIAGTSFNDPGAPLNYLPVGTHSYQIRSRWIPQGSSREDFSEWSAVGAASTVTIPAPNGSITVNVNTGSGTPVNGETIIATRISYDQSSVCSSLIPLASINLGVTSGNGSITMDEIYYGHEDDDPTVYRISVQGKPHIPTADVSLDYQPNNTQTVTLTDTTAYSVTGRLLSSNGCGVAGAEISADGHASSNVAFITNDTTDINGDFTLVLPGPDNYGFYASFQTPTGMFVLDSTNVTITNPSGTYVPIQYSKKDTLRGFVGGDCQAIYGSATVNAYSQSGGCLLATTSSDAGTGLYQFVLNSHDVEVKVENYIPTQGPLMGQSLSQSIDVGLDSTTIVDFVFQAPISMEVSGFPDQLCSDVPYPIMDQAKLYPISLEVTEGSNCYIDTGYVVVTNEISGYDGQAEIVDTVFISNGIGTYYLIPAIPNIFPPYTKPITFQAYSYDGISSSAETISAVVTGASPRGNQFVTVSPQIPRIILRDPPGADSYSFIEENETFSTSTKTYFQHTEGGNVWAKMKTGIDTDIFGIKLVAGVEIGASISGSKTHVNSEETVYEFESGFKVKTSDNNYITGSNGDVYIGAAMNLTYANSDIISFDLANCEVNKRVELIVDADSFSTQFALTESYILNTTIPNLQAIVNDMSQTAAQRHLAEQSIKVWHQVINLNKRLKEEAFNTPAVTNYTISNAEVEQSYTETTTQTATIEWTSLIEESVGLEAGFSLNGTGPSGGFEVNFKQEFGKSESNTTTTTTRTGFFLGDDTPGDSYTIDWAFDPVFGTPVFRAANNAGQTSCPWELGARRDKPYFSVPDPIQTSGTNSVSFDIILGNHSETNETRSYILERVSNPLNATVQIQGTFGPIWTKPDMPPGNEVINVIVTKPANEHFHFEGMQFKFYPACDQNDAVYNSFSVFFDSPCSDIAMTSPTPVNGFVINEDAGNMLPIEIGGYAYNDIQPGDAIVLEYTTNDTLGWSTSNIDLSKSDLNNNNPANTPVIWSTNGIEDGFYDIRMKLTCTSGPNNTSTYSPRVSGVIDRTPPQVLGTSEPQDDDYAMGDEISVLFDEEVVASNAQLILTMLPDDVTVTASLILDSNEVSVFPSADISTEIGKIFEVVITDLEDVYGNSADPVSWSFTVGEIDTDGDGYSDGYEQCIGSALHFSATASDHIVVPHDNALNVVENGLDFTFSAWVFHSPVTAATIISKGSGSGPDNEYIFNIWSTGGVNHRLGLYLSGEWQLGNSTVPTNQWVHVAVAFDGATKTAEFFINGVPDGSKTYTSTFSSGNTDPLYIGRQGSSCNCNFFDGRMDDVSIWQHKLTQAEIMATMAGALNGSEPDLVASFDFNDYESCVSNVGNSTAMDKSANNFVGNLTGFSLEGCTSNWATERYMDNDRDGIPDGCDVIDPCFDLQDPGDSDGDLLLACADLCPSTKDVAMDFDGAGDYFAYYLGKPLFDDDFALEAWVNPEGDIQESILYGFDPILLEPIFRLEIKFKRIALFLIDTTAGEYGEYTYSASEVPLNKWSHIAVSFDGATKKATFYLNGKFDGEREYMIPSIYSPPGFFNYIGLTCDTNGCSAYEGRMDDVAIWSRSLTEYNVQKTMEAPIAGTENGLEGYYDFNEGVACGDNTSISSLIDKSPNGANAAIYSFVQNNGCSSNWVMGRNKDSDGDTIGDACDTSEFGCPPNFAGANQLVGDQVYPKVYDTDGAIESIQKVKNNTLVIYNTNTSIELLPEFEVKLGSALELKIDGCPD